MDSGLTLEKAMREKERDREGDVTISTIRA